MHEDAWIYSEHVPIETGVSTPMQAWQAMDYTDWAMEHFPFAFGGEMRQTSNYVPGQWSIREAYPGDNFAMAMGYALAGRGDDGWNILRGTMLHSMYGDPSPMRGYGNEKGQYGHPNIVSPGGLSHPNCGIDFNDITSSFGRAVVEGVFGYLPDYPNHKLRLQPAFPSAWDHASIRTPDFSLGFRRTGVTDTYKVTLLRPTEIQLRVPVRARQVKAVTVNGMSVKPNIQPWSECGMLTVTIPAGRESVVAIELFDRVAKAEPIILEKVLGESIEIAAKSPISDLLDPQASLGSPALAGAKLSATVSGKPGYRLLFFEMAGEVPWYQPVKLHITDPVGEAARAAKSPRVAPKDAKWQCLDLAASFNGDIRTVYKQQYRSPRPDTVSMRIGYDGWSAWTFTHWGIPVPEPKPDAVEKLKDASGRLMTPSNVPFLPPSDGPNIAFTSLWDNWPRSVTVPVKAGGDAVWLLLCGSTNPMQLKIANAILRFKYADGQEESLDLVPPSNFWSLARFGRVDYEYKRDGFALPKEPPPQVMLGEDCRAIVAGWKLRPGVELESVTLETLSQDVIIGLMGVSIMNPAK